MTRPQTRQLIAVLLALTVLLAGVAAPAVAASTDDDDGEDDGIDWSEKTTSVLGKGASLAEATHEVVGGMMSNAFYRAERVGSHEPKRTPAECANDIQSEVNNHSAAYEAFLNQRVNATAGLNVIEFRCTYAGDEGVTTETVFVVADVNNGSYENVTATKSTNRSADDTFVLTGKATEEMPDELASFRKTYVAENTTPPESYKAGLTTKYGGYVYGTPEFVPAISEAHEDVDEDDDDGWFGGDS